MWEILAAAAMVCFGTYYFLNKKKHRRIALACKAFATAMPGLLLIRYALRTGLIRFGTVPSGSAGAAGCQELSGISAAAFWFTLAAIVFYMAADVLLECRFVLGAVSFAAGHILMSAGILLGTADAGSFVEAGWVRFLCFALILFCVYAGAACFILRSFIPHLRAKKLFLPAAAYIAVLSMMAACAGAAGLLRGGVSGAALALGGISFVVSDVLLGQNRLGRKRSRVKGAAVLVLYYLAVYLLVISYLVNQVR